MPSILLTRPHVASEQLAFELGQRGYAGVVEPLLKIQPTLFPPPDLTRLQAVMLTSGNAIDCLSRERAEAAGLLRLPCFCVGTHTADAARLFGFTNVHDARGDGLALAGHIGGTLDTAGGAILHICGRATDSKGRDALQAKNYDVRSWEVYEAEAVTTLSPFVLRWFQEKKFDAVLLYSTRTAETLVALIKKHGLESCCEHMIALGISEAVLAPLDGIRWQQKTAALQPTDQAVIERLQEVLPVK